MVRRGHDQVRNGDRGGVGSNSRRVLGSREQTHDVWWSWLWWSNSRRRSDDMEKEKPKSEMMIGGGGGGGGLESSLSQFVQEHHQTSLRLGEQTEKAKKDALTIGMRVSDLLVDTVNGGVQESFINAKRIEHEIRALTATVIRYTKQTDQWLAASHAINSVLKQLTGSLFVS